jgi:hypothetical protein
MAHHLLYQVRRDKLLLPLVPTTTEPRPSTMVTRVEEEEGASFAAAPASATTIEAQDPMTIPEITPPSRADSTGRHIPQANLFIIVPQSTVDQPRAPHRRPCSLVTLGTRQAQLLAVTRHQSADYPIQAGQHSLRQTLLLDPRSLAILVVLHLPYPLPLKLPWDQPCSLLNSHTMSLSEFWTSIHSWTSSEHALPSYRMSVETKSRERRTCRKMVFSERM